MRKVARRPPARQRLHDATRTRQTVHLRDREDPTSENTSWVTMDCFLTTAGALNSVASFRQVSAWRKMPVETARGIHIDAVNAPSVSQIVMEPTSAMPTRPNPLASFTGKARARATKVSEIQSRTNCMRIRSRL